MYKYKCEKIETNTKMCNEIKKIVKEINVKRNMSYAQVAATNIVMLDVSKCPTNNQTDGETEY